MGNLYRENSFKVVGTLLSANVQTGNRKSDGAGFVTTTAIVKSNIGGKDKEYEIVFRSNEKTVDGNPNKLYATYVDMPSSIGKKVEINGEIQESRFWSDKAGQIISSQRLNGKWFKGALPTATDEGSFVIGGFIAKELVDKTNKSNEIYRHDVLIGQETYQGSGKLQLINLNVDPSSVQIVNGVRNYKLRQTVKVTGSLDFFSQVTTKNEDSAFGTITKTYTNTQRNFFIEAGSNPMSADEGAFDVETINTLMEAYKANDATLMNSKKSDTPAVETEAPVTKRQTSLI